MEKIYIYAHHTQVWTLYPHTGSVYLIVIKGSTFFFFILHILASLSTWRWNRLIPSQYRIAEFGFA